jgi:HPt (histidine-containing phosphotransfer) domain-containing protein
MNFKELAENIGLSEEEYLEIVALFMSTGVSDLDDLEKANETNDVAGVANAAHRLNGASGNLGFMEIQTLAQKIELAAGDKKFDDISCDIKSITTLFSELADLLGQ